MKLKQAYILCALLFVLLCFLLPPAGTFDSSFWYEWAWKMKGTGFAHAYLIDDLNYNPLYLYVIRFYSSLFTTYDEIIRNIAYLKIFTLLFDFGAVLLLMNWLKKYGRDFFICFFILINIGYLYNTLYWGQVDAIHTTLIFASLVAVIEQRLALSMVLFLLALNTKTQSILFIPPMLLVWLPMLKGRGREVVKGLGYMVVIQMLILLPFILKGTTGAVWHNLVGVVDYNPFASMRAYNFWYLTFWENSDVPRYIPDTDLFWGISYKVWGLLLFFITSAIALLPMFIRALVKFLKRETFVFTDAEPVFLALTLIAIIFFYFPTQMHERYAHPAVLLSGVYFVLSRRWLLFVMISYAYVMNLEPLDKCWRLVNYKTLIFDARLVGSLYALALLIGAFRLYRNYTFGADFAYLKARLFNKQLA